MEAPIFTALADPVRRSLLIKLAEQGPRTATQFAEEYPITRQAILKHLAVLEAAGLVVVQQRGREKQYVLTPEPLDEIERWLKDVGARWGARLLRLKALVGDQMAGE